MGSLSVWHGLIALLVIAIPLFLAGIVWLIYFFSRGKARAAPLTSALLGNTENRLVKLDTLLEQGHITRNEYDRQRAAIIAGV